MRILRGKAPALAAGALTAFCGLSLCTPPAAEGGHTDAGLSSSLSLSRLLLQWEDGTGSRLVGKGAALKATAVMDLQGAGIISGEWEIAGPGKGSGEPLFEKLLFINTYISETGTEELRSPLLPTSDSGSYILRLTITSPKIAEKSHDIRYFVGSGPAAGEGGHGGEVPDSIDASGPSKGVTAAGESGFSWNAVPGSIAYQVEIFDKLGGEKVIPDSGRFNICTVRVPSDLKRPPTMGIMVPAYLTETTLDDIVAGRPLASGRTYLWRIVALGTGGRVLCESPFKEFFFPE